MKLLSSINKLLTKKWMLNLVAILSLFNIIGYSVIGNVNIVLYFIVTAVLTYFFSKNMTIVLGVALVVSNIIALGEKKREGMETQNGETTNLKNKKANQKKIDKLMNDTKNKETNDTLINSMEGSSNGTEQQGFEPGRKKNRGHQIDYATTIEDAYDELNNILGSDGIQRLTSDTQNLMKQQMQLAEAMKGMTPVIQQIQPMVENLKGMMGQLGNGKEGLGGIMDLAKQFTNKGN